jgi:hypothetical protein
LSAAFTQWFVLVPGPLPVYASVTDGEYPPGTKVGGIAWKPQFTELKVSIQNPTNKPYEDLNILLRPNEPVAAISQISDLPEVSFQDNNGGMTRLFDIDQSGISKVAPLALLGTDAGYRVQCHRLPAHSTLKIVMALADFKWAPAEHHPGLDPGKAVRESNYVVKMRFDDFSSYWLGHEDGDVYAPRPSSSPSIKVEADYLLAHRPRHLSQRVQVDGRFIVRRRPSP